MAIITIAREIASLGEETAQELAHICGYRLIDKEYLEGKLNSIGISAEKRAKYDEKNPGFWASLSQQRDDYLHFLKSAITGSGAGEQLHHNGGRGAYAILRVPAAYAFSENHRPSFGPHRADKKSLLLRQQTGSADHRAERPRSGPDSTNTFFRPIGPTAASTTSPLTRAPYDPACAALAIDALRKGPRRHREGVGRYPEDRPIWFLPRMSSPKSSTRERFPFIFSKPPWSGDR